MNNNEQINIGLKLLLYGQNLEDNLKNDNSYTSNEKFIDAVTKQFNKEIEIFIVENEIKQTITKKSASVFKPNASYLKLKNAQIADLMFTIPTLAYKETKMPDNSIIREFFIRDYDTHLPIYKPFDISTYMAIMSTKVDITDLKRTERDIEHRMQKLNTPEFKKVKKLNIPPNHIILMPNGILNLKNMEFSKNINEFGEFDFINNTYFKLLDENNINKLYLEIVKRIFNDWSDNKPDHLLYLKQLCFAALDGNGRNTYNVLKAGGGNGKSTFLTILENLAGKQFTQKLDLHNIMDDNSLVNISISSKLIVGHDMATNAKLSSYAISRFKEFTLGEPFQINVKYKDNQLCQTYGLKVQSTNSDMTFFENTDAIRRRLNMFNWTEKKFTKSSFDEKIDLGELVGLYDKPNTDFYEALIYYIMSDITYFKTFSVPQSSIEKTNQMVNEADNVYQFLVYLDDRGLMTGKILLNHLYKMYLWWNKFENSNNIPMSNRLFAERIKKLHEEFNYNLETNDKFEFVRHHASKLGALECNLDVINDVFFNKALNLSKRDKSFVIIFNNQINEDFIKNFNNRIKNDNNNIKFDDLTYDELLVLYNEINNKGNMDAALIINN